MWWALRWLQLPHRFRRQHPIGPFIADFACPSAKLVIEIDGGQHYESRSDARRTATLASYGYKVIRFWNNDVLTNTTGVVAVIRAELERQDTLSALEGGEGGAQREALGG